MPEVAARAVGGIGAIGRTAAGRAAASAAVVVVLAVSLAGCGRLGAGEAGVGVGSGAGSGTGSASQSPAPAPASGAATLGDIASDLDAASTAADDAGSNAEAGDQAAATRDDG